jgi:hypothetical protein
VAMVETVAEGEAYAKRDTYRGWDEGTYETWSEWAREPDLPTDLFLATNIIIIFRGLTYIPNLPSLPPHLHF